MTVEFITKQDFEEFKREVLTAIGRISKSDNNEKEWLRTKGACDLLKCSEGTLQNLRIKGTIGYSKIGVTIYYNRESIIKAMKENYKN